MGIIRGTLFVLVTTLFIISVFAAGMTYVFASSLKYDNVKTTLPSVIKEIAEQEVNLTKEFGKIYPAMQSYCKNNSEYVTKFGDYTFIIPCETVSQGLNVVINEALESIVEDIYYKEYDCRFLSCFKRNELPLFLISEKARAYWGTNFYIFLGLSAALAALMFIFAAKKANMLLVSGIILISSSILILKLGDILTSFKGLEKYVGIFFTASYSVFLGMLILGILILVAGVILKIFGIGLKISGLVSKVKSVKEEVSEEKKEEKGKEKQKKEKSAEKNEEKPAKASKEKLK